MHFVLLGKNIHTTLLQYSTERRRLINRIVCLKGTFIARVKA